MIRWPALGSTAPIPAMRIPVLLALAAAALALLFALLARGGGGGARDAEVLQPPAAEAPAAPPAAEFGHERAGPARAVDEVAEAQPDPGAAAAPARSYPLHGVALDVHGAPVAGVGLAAASDGASAEPRARTGDDGSFAFELPRTLAELVSTDPAWLVLSGGDFDAKRGGPLHLVLGPRGALAGLVVDARTEEPVPGAAVRAVAPPSFTWDPGERGETRAGADGAFALAGVPDLPGMRLSAAAPGYLEAVLEPAPGASSAGVLRLEPADPPRARGRVVLADGSPAAGAVVALGSSSTRADEQGAFDLAVPRPEPGAELLARLPARLPALGRGVGARLLAGESVEGLELVLEESGAALAGRVVDAAGKPQKAMRVTAQALAAEGQGQDVTVVRTRKDGEFELAGLVPGPYSLIAEGHESGVLGFMAEVEAPSAGLELVTVAGARRIAGVVLRADGGPAPGIGVELLPPGDPRAKSFAHGRTTRTDAAGRFGFDGAPAHALALRALPPPVAGALPLVVQIAAGGDQDVPLRLPAAHSVRFEALDAAAPPDALFAVDAGGAPVPLGDAGGGQRLRVDLAAGRSQAFLAPDSAALLVLTRGGRELARIALAPDGNGLVRW